MNGNILIPFVLSLSNALLSLSKRMNGIHLFSAFLEAFLSAPSRYTLCPASVEIFPGPAGTGRKSPISLFHSH